MNRPHGNVGKEPSKRGENIKTGTAMDAQVGMADQSMSGVGKNRWGGIGYRDESWRVF